MGLAGGRLPVPAGASSGDAPGHERDGGPGDEGFRLVLPGQFLHRPDLVLLLDLRDDCGTSQQITRDSGGDLLVLGQAVVGHSLAPRYVRWQVGRNREQLGRERLDLVLLHNPERAHPGDRPTLHRAMREAFVVVEETVAAGNVAGYGIATWAGLEEEAFTVEELLALAAEAAGGRHHLVAVQMPVSLVMMTPITQALHGRGPLPAAAGAGLRVMASAPLHGGELPGIVDQEVADLIRPGLTPAQACVLAVASCPGVTDVLLAASGASHWKEAADAVAQSSLTAAKLREITGVLASP